MKKAYFVAPLFAKDKFNNTFLQIADILKHKGFNVHDDVNKVTSEDAQKMSDQEISKYFTKVETLIRQSDIFVAELTVSSPSVGYEIGYAIANSKPVLILRHEGTQGTLGAPFRANKNKITIFNYNDSNLESQIDKFLTKAEKGIFMKRLPIEFTKEQVDYVEDLKNKLNQRSFNSTVRHIIDKAIANENP